jgi:trehalose 6-phosphate synthase complex regulatory subunit
MYESSSFVQYKAVNEAFAEKIVSIWKEGDISECISSHAVEGRAQILIFTPVWVNDYHLLLLPQLLRVRLPKAAIGFFLHVAFPSSEIFRCLSGEAFSS